MRTMAHALTNYTCPLDIYALAKLRTGVLHIISHGCLDECFSHCGPSGGTKAAVVPVVRVFARVELIKFRAL